MAIELSKMTDKELDRLQKNLGKELAKRDKAKLEQARKAAEAAAKQHGYDLSTLFGVEKPARKTAEKKKPAPAKYRNPDKPDQTWSGRGRQPQWYKAHVEAGRDPKDLEIG